MVKKSLPLTVEYSNSKVISTFLKGLIKKEQVRIAMIIKLEVGD